MNYKLSARIMLWAVRFCMLALVALAVFAPKVVQWYVGIRRMEDVLGTVILVAFYACTPSVALALWTMDRLLRRFTKGDVFTHANVGLIRLISVCCALVAVATICGGIGYPPLWFVALLMAFLCLAVLVVAQVLDAATAIREENDLTI